MRARIAHPSTPSDPVVAVHRSRSGADAAMHALAQAGFGNDMLELVGQRGDVPALARDIGKRTAPPWRGATPGLLLGALWTTFFAAATLAFPASEARLPLLLALGVLVISLQAVLVRRVTRPLAGRPHPAAPAGSHPPADASDGSAWSFLVVVHGSRSEVALARDVLAI